MNNRPMLKLLVIAFAAAVLVGWYVFRPERLFLDRRVDEAPPAPATIVLRSGAFQPRVHAGQGLAQVLDLGDARRILRLANFQTDDGPDLQVYLSVAQNPQSSDELERFGYLTLGALKGNIGAQNYEIAPDIEIGRYRSVVIWCRRFGVNFTTAVFE